MTSSTCAAETEDIKMRSLDEPGWSRALKRSPYASPFHSWNWASLTCAHFGGSFRALQVDRGAYQKWLLPCYLDNQGESSFRVGFIGYGGPFPCHSLMPGEVGVETLGALLEAAEHHLGLRVTTCTTFPWAGWNRLELPCLLTRRLPLEGSQRQLFRSLLSGNVRTAIRKAARLGVQVVSLASADVQDAYALLANSQSAVGSSYVTPRGFFEELCLPKPHERFILGARLQDELVAVGVFLLGGGECFHLFHGWSREHAPSCANQAMIWHAVRRALALGCSTFDMGASHSDSLARAKRRWGGFEASVLRANRNDFGLIG